MKINQLFLLLLFLISTVICCPQKCLECDEDQIQCLICIKGYKLEQETNTCLEQSQHFSYEHQQQWEGTCREGNRQSPIDIVARNARLCPRDQVMLNKLSTEEITIEPVGENLKALFPKLSNITFYDSGIVRKFESAQFHWHHPSEHTIDGNPYDLELHIVHPETDAPGQYSVIGLLFRVNQQQNINLIDDLDFVDSNQTRPFSFPWDIKDKMFFHYKGSLTTPPCSETVEWFVITEIYDISKSDFERIREAINEGNSNARDAQPLNGRRPVMLGKFCNIYRRMTN